MADHDIFVSTNLPSGDVRAVIEAELGTAFSPSEDPEPVPTLASGTTRVFFHDTHGFEDDRDFPVTRYRYWINVHDTARNEQRQLATAQQIFAAMKTQNWPAMLTFNLQGNITRYP